VARLIYSSISSLDGYIEDRAGNFDWAMPEADVHAFINDLERHVGTYLYGRRMYETMTPWETDPQLVTHSPITRDFAAIWQAAEKIVYSRSLRSPRTARTRIEARFDPDEVRRIKATASRPLSIGGPTVAKSAFEAGLVDELQLFLLPIVIGSGKPSLPVHGKLDLQLMEQRRFPGGTLYLRYLTRI
jgi:dihydrofolate reductase